MSSKSFQNASNLNGIVSVLQFGAVGDGAADDTAAIQAGLNYIATNQPLQLGLYFPTGKYNFTSLSLPIARGYCIFGDGVSSILAQKGTGIKIATTSVSHDLHATIRDLHFDGTDGTGDTLDLSFTQTTDVVDCSFTNVPAGYSSLRLNGNPVSGVYSHDFRVRGIRIYNRYDYNKLGFAGIVLGSQNADTLITDFVMEGMFKVQYCLYVDEGALTTVIADSHIFNPTKNVVKLAGYNTHFQFDNCIFDYAYEDLIYIKNTSNAKFSNCTFYIMQNWGITIDDSYNSIFLQSAFVALNDPALSPGITGYIREINVGGNGSNSSVLAQCVNPYLAQTCFQLNSPTSYATGNIYAGAAPANFPKQTFFGSVYFLTGATQVVHPQNVSYWLGQNGLSTAGYDDTNWSIPTDGYVKSVRIDSTSTPAAGQTFQFELYKGGTLISNIGSITNGNFSVELVLTNTTLASVSKGDALYIVSTFSATSGASHLRYSVVLTG